MANRSARERVIAARAKMSGAAARRVRAWAFGHEALFPGDPRRAIVMDHTVAADNRFIRFGDQDGEPVVIGRWTAISPTATIMHGGVHRPDWVSAVHVHWEPDGFVFPDGALNSVGPVVIGSDVLIAYEALVMGGVSIGHGAIVATRAVVTKSVEPYSIVGGNPARHIKYRFDEETRAALLRIRWWDWPEEKVLRLRHEIDSPDVAGFIARHDPGV